MDTLRLAYIVGVALNMALCCFNLWQLFKMRRLNKKLGEDVAEVEELSSRARKHLNELIAIRDGNVIDNRPTVH